MEGANAWILVEPLKPALKSGRLQEPYNFLIEKMREAGPNPFDIILQADFTNEPEDIAAVFDDFIETACDADRTKLIYTEMNGFTINTDRWDFEPFGFSRTDVIATEDFGDFDWFSDNHTIVLTGLEELQDIYENEVGFRYQRDLAAFLVISKFQHLMRASTLLMKRKNLPVFADGHDHDFVALVSGS